MEVIVITVMKQGVQVAAILLLLLRGVGSHWTRERERVGGGRERDDLQDDRSLRSFYNPFRH